MHETGCDGWTASIAAGDYSTFTTASPVRGGRLMAHLYGVAPRAA